MRACAPKTQPPPEMAAFWCPLNSYFPSTPFSFSAFCVGTFCGRAFTANSPEHRKNQVSQKTKETHPPHTPPTPMPPPPPTPPPPTLPHPPPFVRSAPRWCPAAAAPPCASPALRPAARPAAGGHPSYSRGFLPARCNGREKRGGKGREGAAAVQTWEAKGFKCSQDS